MEVKKRTKRNVKNKRSCACRMKRDLEISIPGFQRLFDPSYSNYSKSVWLIIMLICAAVCFYLTADRFNEYAKGPTSTKVIVTRKKLITFPTFSICSTTMLHNIGEIIKKEKEEMCNLNNRTECAHQHEIKLKIFNISLDRLWQQHRISVAVDVSSMKPKPGYQEGSGYATVAYQIAHVDGLFGSCVVITHTEAVPYFSTATLIRITIFDDLIMEDITYYFVPHGVPATHVLTTDIFTHEFEDVKRGFHSEMKIIEEQFISFNRSNKECYDILEERKRINNCVMDILKSETCRLPFLPQEFPECMTLKEVEDSIKYVGVATISFIPATCMMRPVCNESVYPITIDYNYPTKDNTTILVLMLADNTVKIREELYTYLFPALVSDLFAYWGFFLSLSALVFAEIFEALIKYCFH